MQANATQDVAIRRAEQRDLVVVAITPPPANERCSRRATFAQPGEKKSRYTLPDKVESSSPIGFRTRLSLSHDEAQEALKLLSMPRPTGFGPIMPIREGELFDESALGVLVARQSTNFRGHKQVTLGPDDAKTLEGLLKQLDGAEAEVLSQASYAHVVLCRPYRTPFTFLLTFVGHKPLQSFLTVGLRALKKRLFHASDIPTIEYLPHLHIGVLADTLERAVVIASEGTRRAQVFMAPFSGEAMQSRNRDVLTRIERLVGLSANDKAKGWRIALVAQVGQAKPDEAVRLPKALYRKLGANFLAFRSERIQPGVNQDDKAPEPYQKRQAMDVPEDLTVMAGRAAYNAFAHWTHVSREAAKDLLLLERVDVLTPNGKERLREIRAQLAEIADKVVGGIPLWVDLPLMRALSKNAARGKKAFALAGQRIYIAGLARAEVERAGLNFELALRAVGAAAARSSLYAELMGVTDIPPGCDLLAGICLMAGPVNQNDIGKAFFRYPDLLAKAFPGRDTTSLLVWTLKAKTVADPIGNEEQLMNAARKGALVDLRPGPHEAVSIRKGGTITPMRRDGERVSYERAYADMKNFVTDPDGTPIANNAGEPWPARNEILWPI